MALWWLSFVSTDVSSWVTGCGGSDPGVASFLYATIASIGLGMSASCLRWALIDAAHHATGLSRPAFDDARLTEHLSGYDWLVENHYRYYQFYGNTLIATLFAWWLWRLSLAEMPTNALLIDGGVLVMLAVFAAGSRSAMRRYYERVASLLGSSEGARIMTNGGHPTAAKKDAPKAQTAPKANTSAPNKSEAKKPDGSKAA